MQSNQFRVKYNILILRIIDLTLFDDFYLKNALLYLKKIISSFSLSKYKEF